VCIFLFALAASAHMTILQINRRRGKKFLISGMLFGFCMARIVTCSLRMAWASYSTNISVAIAAQVFVAAGVLLLFVVNLIFSQRILRASHPRFGWAAWLSVAFKVYYASIVIMIIALITCVTQSFYTLSHNTLRIDHDVLLIGGTYFAVAAFLPIPIILLALAIPSKSHKDHFGEGRFRTKVFIVLSSSTILTLGAAFRAGTNFVPRPASDPAWYDSKACFYLFNFTIEWIVVFLYAVIRVDKRFIIPDKAHGPGAYGGHKKEEKKRSEFLASAEGSLFDLDDRAAGTENNRSDADLEAGRSPITAVNRNHEETLAVDAEPAIQENVESEKPI
jgi:hypothetical protein